MKACSSYPKMMVQDRQNHSLQLLPRLPRFKHACPRQAPWLTSRPEEGTTQKHTTAHGWRPSYQKPAPAPTTQVAWLLPPTSRPKHVMICVSTQAGRETLHRHPRLLVLSANTNSGVAWTINTPRSWSPGAARVATQQHSTQAQPAQTGRIGDQALCCSSSGHLRHIQPLLRGRQ